MFTFIFWTLKINDAKFIQEFYTMNKHIEYNRQINYNIKGKIKLSNSRINYISNNKFKYRI